MRKHFLALAVRAVEKAGRVLGKALIAGKEHVDQVKDCNSCPFLYVSLPYGQLRNRCVHPACGEDGLKLKRPMFTVETLRKSFPPASDWDREEQDRADLGEHPSIEEGFTPNWCPLKRKKVALVVWRGR